MPPIPAYGRGTQLRGARGRLAALTAPYQAIHPNGVIDVGDAELIVVECAPVNFALRTAEEQEALVGAMARWLHSLDQCSVQILVRSHTVNLAGIASDVREQAAAAVHPAIESAARDHADFLSALDAEQEILTRQVLLVIRDRRRGRVLDHAAEAIASLGAAEVAAHVLPPGDVEEVLRSAADPFAPPPEATVNDATTNSRRPPRPDPRSDTRWSGVGSRPRVDRSRAWIGGPHCLEIGADAVRAGDGYATSLAVTGFAGEVGLGWLEPLLAWPGRMDVSLFVDPMPAEVAATRLRKQRSRLESARRTLADRGGSLDDPEVDAAAGDAADLAARLARGAARLYRMGVYLTVRAAAREQLTADVTEVRSLAAGVLMDATVLTWRQGQGWATALPLAADAIDLRRTADTDAVAAAFPFASPDVPIDPGGVLYGVNLSSPGIVTWNRWAQDNHNSVILARSGAGKSFLAKLDLMRSLIAGVRGHVIDPEDEYGRLAEQLGGTVVRLGADEVRINPLELPRAGGPDALRRQALFVHSLMAVMLGERRIDALSTAALDRAIRGTYHRAGVTRDPRTHTRPAPTLLDLAAMLRRDKDRAAAGLLARLEPWINGSYASLVAGPSTVHADGHLVVYSIRDLPEELRPVGMMLALSARFGSAPVTLVAATSWWSTRRGSCWPRLRPRAGC
ncbi:VirB4 family type IV secretion system protein [Fodinicola feengrottensis]|uniref:VirB4 family type IV secretion system protein n=1 Tax=Fodinicola feengrottensis TaxID=435914 RepID=UPI0024436BF6|nr:DUF87 domain-containing protein [Fodinicola feengrottensis]